MKKSISLLGAVVCLCLIVCALSGRASAAVTMESGQCGENLTWTLDDTGLLVISGEGDMEDYAYDVPAPWGTEITGVQIADTVTSVGNYAFAECSKLTRIMIPGSVTRIGAAAFAYSNSLECIMIQDGIETIEAYTFRNCNDYVNIILPASVRTVEEKAFEDANSRGKIMFLGDAPKMGHIFGYITGHWPAYQIYYPAGNTTWDSHLSRFPGVAVFNSFVAPSVEALPDTVSIWYYGSAKLTANARGTGLSYQWYYREADMTDFEKDPNNTRPTYSCYARDLKEGGRRVYCVVTDTYGIQLRTNTTHLRMELNLIGYTDDLNVVAGEPAIAIVDVVGDGLTYRWYYKNKNATDFSYTSSFRGNTYTIPSMNKARDGRQVYCVITDQYGDSLQSPTITIELKEFAEIITQPQDVNVPAGETAKVMVEAVGDELTYQWYFAGKNATEFERDYDFDGNFYQLTMGEDYDGCRVYCVLTDAYGTAVTTETVTLEMKESAQIITQPQDICVANGETAAVKVTAKGDGLIYRWYYKNKGDTKYTYTSSFTGDTYSITMTDARAGRRVLCIVYDVYGNQVQSQSAQLNQAVRITAQPQSVCVANGETATVKVTAKGDGLVYRWYYKDKGAAKYTYTSSFKGDTYFIAMTDARAGRRVLCKIYDKYGNQVQSKSVLLSQAVRITQQPQSVCVANGKTASVKVTALGEALIYRWYYRNRGETKYTYTSGFSGNTYYVTMTDARAGRSVLCRVYDKYGNVVQSEAVQLNQAVWITGQPQSVKVKVGATASVAVTAKGDGLTYRWYFKDLRASEFRYTASFKGSTYSVEMTNARSGRQVYCVITDKYGNSVQSQVVTLRRIWPEITAEFACSCYQSYTSFGWAYEYRCAIASVSGGNGDYDYTIESYEYGKTAPINTVEGQNSISFYVYGGSGANVYYKITIRDSEGNAAVYKLDSSGSVMSYETE